MRSETKYITAGELARLANTTKRTIHYYDQKGILEPRFVKKNGYRYYEPEQVLEWQIISLLQRLGLELDDIKDHLHNGLSLMDLFKKQKQNLHQRIGELEYSLSKIEEFYNNINQNGTYVAPQIKKVKAFSVYYIKKKGPYAQIGNYCRELLSLFSQKPSKQLTLSMFPESNYNPKDSIIYVGVLDNGQYTSTPNNNEVKHMKVPSHWVLYCIHNGPSDYLSLMWQSLEEYRYKNSITHLSDNTFPYYDIEYYQKVVGAGAESKYQEKFELQIPIRL